MKIAFYIAVAAIAALYGLSWVKLERNALVPGRANIEATQAFSSLEELAAYRLLQCSSSGVPVEGSIYIEKLDGVAALTNAGWVDARYIERNANAKWIGIR